MCRLVLKYLKNNVCILTVLLLLTITGWLLQCSDYECSCRWNNRNLGLSVLYDQLNGDLETLPVTCGFGNVITNLLGGLWGNIYISKIINLLLGFPICHSQSLIVKNYAIHEIQLTLNEAIIGQGLLQWLLKLLNIILSMVWNIKWLNVYQ